MSSARQRRVPSEQLGQSWGSMARYSLEEARRTGAELEDTAQAAQTGDGHQHFTGRTACAVPLTPVARLRCSPCGVRQGSNAGSPRIPREGVFWRSQFTGGAGLQENAFSSPITYVLGISN